jgi:energy-coupling factor transport system permease protein
MQLLTPLVADPRAPLAATNPVARLGAATLLMLACFLAVDLVTPLLVLAVELVAVPLSGLRALDLLRRAWPLLFAAVGIGLANALLPAEAPGVPLVAWGPLQLSTGSLLVGAALALRVLGIAFVGVLALASVEPTELADALGQQLRLSPRFAIGALAAVRLLPLLAEEWQIMALARRARGVEAGRSPIAAARLFAGQMLALLVAAIRRGTRLALAMEARGFGSRDCRTWARPQRMHPRDWLLLGAALAVGIGATAISMALGHWRFLFG